MMSFRRINLDDRSMLRSLSLLIVARERDSLDVVVVVVVVDAPRRSAVQLFAPRPLTANNLIENVSQSGMRVTRDA